MDVWTSPVIDRSLTALAQGYAWLPGLLHERPDGAARTRVLGKPALVVRGPDAVRFFYDEHNVRREGALPPPVLSTLFGHDAVHTLDGGAHLARKEFFLPLLRADRIACLVEHVVPAWDEAVREWSGADQIVLFDAASVVLTRGVCRWAGVPLDEGAGDTERLARDLVAMVDGFATAGPRHWRARRARSRQEERFSRLVEDVRSGRVLAPEGSVLASVCRHHEATGELLRPHTAAVELLNVVRPTVAVCWFVAYAAHALHLRPHQRERLRGGDTAYTAAFVHEVRRFYPFVPFLGGLAVRDLSWKGVPVPSGAMVLLDVFGQNHDEELWGDPYVFRPQRFFEHPVGRDELIPQGGGEPRSGHRCPGEGLTIGLLEALALRLAGLEYTVPDQDLRISLRRIPARVRSGFAVRDVRAPSERKLTAV
ncbi:cytochrome P450 [Streptomyces sp. NRRL WC-3618]|uniref:cytochrome P450 n=1 Tax=Streptomyces sp. NRRL WC-3618 TaxID=1519490 RepID=UPI0006ADC575|nr:cytochrome P450 [Streptomyces sp. NRRL WC-3618]KOV70545.1 cytochrome P450 [Streptomyces sp. NRRL WC-3618]